MKFKCGDKVVVVQSVWEKHPIGTISTITGISNLVAVADLVEDYNWHYTMQEAEKCLRHLTKLEKVLK